MKSIFETSNFSKFKQFSERSSQKLIFIAKIYSMKSISWHHIDFHFQEKMKVLTFDLELI